MNDLQIFSNTEFGELRTIEENGITWFCATDVAKALGYSNPWDAIKRHCKKDGLVKREGVSYTTNQYGVTSEQKSEMTFINEGNVFRLITHSKLPKAEQFEKWVFDEVLPTIHKTGGYGNANNNYDIELISRIIIAIMKDMFPTIYKSLHHIQKDICDDTDIKLFDYKKANKNKDYEYYLEVKSDIDQMINDKFDCKEISEFCKNNGFDISISSIEIYKNKIEKNNVKTCKNKHNQPYKITLFPIEIKSAVDFMICNKISTAKIAQYCCMNGYNISSMSVWRYKNRYFPYI